MIRRYPAAYIGFTFLTALIIASVLPTVANAVIGAVLFTAAIVFCAVYHRNRMLKYAATVSLLVFIAGAAFGIYSFRSYTADRPVNGLEGKKAYVTGSVIAMPDSSDRFNYVIKTDNVYTSGYKYRESFRFVLVSKDCLNGDIYDKFRGTVVFYQGRDVQNGAFIKAYRDADGKISFTPTEDKGVTGLLYNIRKAVSNRLDEMYESDVAALMKSVILGDKTDIPDKTMNLFRRAGVSHVIVVSGAHMSVISIIAMWMVSCMPMFRRKRYAVICSVAVVCFMLLSGFGPSVTRAGICSLLVLMGLMSGRKANMLNLLGAAALIAGTVNPFVAVSVSFQLSFFATVGIVISGWFGQRFLNRLRPKPALRKVLQTVFTTIGAQAAVFPILMSTFTQISVVALIVNLLIFWAIALMIASAAIAVAMSFLYLQPISMIFTMVSGVLGKYCLETVRFFGSMRFASVVITQKPALIISLAVMLSAILIIKLRLKKGAVIAIVAVIALSAFGCAAYEYNSMRITVTGEHCVVVSFRGRDAVIGRFDNSGDEVRTESVLRSHSCDKIDLVATADDDKGLLLTLLKKYDVEVLACNESEKIKQLKHTDMQYINHYEDMNLWGFTANIRKGYTMMQFNGIKMVFAIDCSDVTNQNGIDIMICDSDCKAKSKTAVVTGGSGELALSAQRVYNVSGEYAEFRVMLNGTIVG